MAFSLVEYNFKQAKEYIDKIEVAYETLKKEKETLSNPAGEFKEYESYPQAPNLKNEYRSYWSRYGDEYKAQEIAQKELDNWFSLCKKVRDDNKKVEEYNAVIFDKAVAFMLSLGLSKTENYKKTSRSVKWSTREAAWLTSIRNLKGNGGGWTRVNDQYVRLTKGIVDRAEAKRKGEEQKERDRKAAIAERKSNLKVALLAQKYVPDDPVECETSEILEAILGRCKYLNLAHWMYKNREDWNDGHDFAEIGLDGFEIESDLDQEIYDDVYSHIKDWDGDGRVFRDCEHNYDSLFTRCDEDLLSDYQSFREMFPDV